jgi:hypothetical protein
LVAEEPQNPVGYFLSGLAYYSIINQFRNDIYADSVVSNLDIAIRLAQEKADKKRPDWNFILGSAYGCRALYRSLHGGWWGAFRDGQHSCSSYEKAYEQDTTFTDALLGIGAYHYWKSAKAKILTIMPFVGDKRKQGIAEIERGIRSGGIGAISGIKSLMPIYHNEKRYADVLTLGDSLIVTKSLDPNSRLHLARAFIALRRWSDAETTLNEIQHLYENSEYCDSCGATEVLYLKAQMLLGQGDSTMARINLRQIISMDSTCAQNAYFRQTSLEAKELLKK